MKNNKNRYIPLTLYMLLPFIITMILWLKFSGNYVCRILFFISGIAIMVSQAIDVIVVIVESTEEDIKNKFRR